MHFAKFEGNYAICFDYSNKLIYNIPKSCIKGSQPEIGDPIKVISSNDFRIDTSGIPANSDNIDELLNECSYANIPLNVNILSELYKIIDKIFKKIKTINYIKILIYQLLLFLHYI